MSLFRTIPTPGDFAPLFRLLDDYDVHRSSKGSKTTTSVRSFTPRFDVRETSDAYHLDGEIPGAVQKDIDIEFTDPQTLVIKGRSEREYHSQRGNGDDQEQDASQGESSSDVAKASTEKQVTKTAQHTPKHRYWVNERTVGEFQRTFSFPTRLNQDGVTANLKNGILSLAVPKAAAPVAKKITIE